MHLDLHVLMHATSTFSGLVVMRLSAEHVAQYVFQSAHFFTGAHRAPVATIEKEKLVGCWSRKYVQRDIKISVLSKTGTASQPFSVTVKEKFFHFVKY